VTEGLTPAQERVAELVVAGSTNAEIARELHMSLRTVESHLTRVYQEHGVRSRTQLIAALASAGGGTGRA
jgi:DNA-binding NarL/FixJ family response regulator